MHGLRQPRCLLQRPASALDLPGDKSGIAREIKHFAHETVFVCPETTLRAPRRLWVKLFPLLPSQERRMVPFAAPQTTEATGYGMLGIPRGEATVASPAPNDRRNGFPPIAGQNGSGGRSWMGRPGCGYGDGALVRAARAGSAVGVTPQKQLRGRRLASRDPGRLLVGEPRY